MTSSHSSVFFIFLLLTLLLTVAKKDDFKDEAKSGLEEFKKNIHLSKQINWTAKSVCDWTGVKCVEDVVTDLRLPMKSLKGSIREGSLGKIRTLRFLSLRDNQLSGELPADFAHLSQLRNVYLQNNSFSGVFPSSVTNWTNLLALDLSDNKFTGIIPTDIINLNRIMHLRLQNNRFTGMFPKKIPSRIVRFSVYNNNLSGRIPKLFAEFPMAGFTKNFDLCNKPLGNHCNETKYPPEEEESLPSNSPDHKKKKLSTGAIVAIGAVSALILLILLLCLGKKLCQAVKEKMEPVVATKAAKVGAESRSERRGEAGTSSSKDDDTGASKLS